MCIVRAKSSRNAHAFNVQPAVLTLTMLSNNILNSGWFAFTSGQLKLFFFRDHSGTVVEKLVWSRAYHAHNVRDTVIHVLTS